MIRKAITPVIAVVLLIMISVAVAGVATFFVMSTQTSTTSGVSTGVSGLVGQSQGRLRVVSVSGDKVVVQNVGGTPVSGSVTTVLDGTATETGSEETLEPGEFTEITVEGTGETNIIIGTTTISFTKTTTIPAVCGDGVCETHKGETITNCPTDCVFTDFNIEVFDNGWVIVDPYSSTHLKECIAIAGGNTYYLNVTEKEVGCSECSVFTGHSLIENASYPYPEYNITLPWTVDLYGGGTSNTMKIVPYQGAVGFSGGEAYHIHNQGYDTSNGYLAYCTKNNPSRVIVQFYAEAMIGGLEAIQAGSYYEKEYTFNRFNMVLYENGSIMYNYFNMTHENEENTIIPVPIVGVQAGGPPILLNTLGLDATTFGTIAAAADPDYGHISVYCELNSGSFTCSKLDEFNFDSCPIDSLYFTAYGQVQAGTANVTVNCTNENNELTSHVVDQTEYSTGGSYTLTTFDDGSSSKTLYYNGTIRNNAGTMLVPNRTIQIEIPINAQVTSATITIAGNEHRGHNYLISESLGRVSDDREGIVFDLDSSNKIHGIYSFDDDDDYTDSQVYYLSSSDSGSSWTSTQLKTNTNHLMIEGFIVKDPYLHGFYSLDDDCNTLLYKRSTNTGTNWDAEVNLSESMNYCLSLGEFGLTFSSTGSKIRGLFFNNNASPYVYDIYFFESTDNGDNWSNAQLVHNINNVGSPEQNSFRSSSENDYLHLAFVNDTSDPVNNDVIYLKSSDGGSSWSSLKDISQTETNIITGGVRIYSSGNYVHLFWVDNRTGNFKIYYARSTDNGDNWSSPTALSGNDLIVETDEEETMSASELDIFYAPSAYLSGSNIYLLWIAYSEGREPAPWDPHPWEFRMISSTDNGASWGSRNTIKIELGTSYNSFPNLLMINNKPQIFWISYWDGSYKNGQIYYSGIHYPNNPWIDVGLDDSYEWTSSGRYSASQEVDIKTAVSNRLSACTTHPCIIPIRAHSDDHGSLTLSSLTVNYDT